MSNDYTDMIELLLKKNNELITEIGLLYQSADAEITNNTDTPEGIDMTYMNSLQLAAKAIEKQIKDNIATIDDLTARNILSEEYYQQEANNFLKRTIHVSNDIPDTIQSGTMLSANIVFRNLGLFYSWTIDKLISLEVKLVDGDNNIISTNDFLFDPTATGNEPGEEALNEDYMKDKAFSIALSITPVLPGEYTFIMTIKDLTYRFYDSYKLNVNML
jgi:hypothetical protein